MTSILELPETRHRVMRMSVEDYHQLTELGLLPRRTELIRGVILDKMSKSPLHLSTSKTLYDLFSRLAPPGFSICQDGPITLADSEPEPDVAVARGSDADFRDHHPSTAELVVEVAVSSAREDRAMAALYAEAGVSEYWIVLPRERRVEVYRRPEAMGYREMRVHGQSEEVVCQSVAGLRVNLAELFPTALKP